jgi:hypothetical protein
MLTGPVKNGPKWGVPGVNDTRSESFFGACQKSPRGIRGRAKRARTAESATEAV